MPLPSKSSTVEIPVNRTFSAPGPVNPRKVAEEARLAAAKAAKAKAAKSSASADQGAAEALKEQFNRGSDGKVNKYANIPEWVGRSNPNPS